MSRKDLFAIGKATFEELGRDDVSMLAAALTYYVFFSIFPLLLLSIIVAGFFLTPEDAMKFVFNNAAQVAPGSIALLTEAINKAVQLRSNAGLLALIGVGALAFSASNAFSVLYKAINRAWNTEHRPSLVMERVISFLMMVAAGLAALALLVLSAILTLIRSLTQESIGEVPGEQVVFQILNIAVSFVIVYVVLIIVYRYVPRTHVLFKDVWLGALLAAIAWTITKELFSLFLGSSFQNYDAVYGTMGAAIALLTWIYLSALIILTGAEFASETNRHRKLNSLAVQPDENERESSPWF